ncbi:DEAD/DEAH box helicase family protein [Paenibacillus motobuensis]|uniref:DEAD/DEAH box helicase family protein n=1 Tax=Paenibacillus TaxID=44249 RepID=UPI00203C835C|nr:MULTISPECIES: DEAD/DEAH box helicase family protein [Paenibacillus]MCM3040652.1 DEAD/DEAH box helicase family protein [Paenibacillus lutimineralis]MCM3647756.1 DEAD/DEAH box helicase family protein [Paenibacillus motobuensis]
MTANFTFLSEQAEYKMFASACIEAERVLATSPAMSAVGSRKALELAVKWVYAADRSILMPYKDNLQSLIHEPTFRFAVDSQTWGKIPYIIKLGNLGVHSNKTITHSEAVLSLASLFDFIHWIDYCYGVQYEERTFDEQLIPTEQVHLDVRQIKEQQGLISEKDNEIERLRAQIEALSQQLTQDKEQHQAERNFTPLDLSEFHTRKKYIDVDLKLSGWTIGDDVQEEVKVEGMPNSENIGFVDYVLYGRDGLPLALIEAKRTSINPKIGTQQAKLYADCLEQKYGQRPIIFNTNGFDTYAWDDLSFPQRKVSGIFSRNDLEKLIKRRTQKQPLEHIVINDKITDRYYQKEAIRAVGRHIEEGHRKALIVMATGTGKTRTASSLTDVLSRGGHVTNVLFLADRKSLVKQAKDDFKQYLPDISLCNLLSNKEDKLARIVFSTYPTILNAIDTAKSEDGQRLYTPAHFDLIIIDEAHRSIFKKYRAIFEYFDAILLGLTATPKSEVDRNTYEFFEVERDVPTYAYDYETAVEKDKVLVPYYNIEVQTKFLMQGIMYDDLSLEDRSRYEEDFIEEDGELPDEIPAPALNEFIFNQNTVDRVLEDLMTRGIKVGGGDLIGKTIIFAQNKRHADFILQRFNKLYPQYYGQLIRKITFEDTYAQSSIDEFKVADKAPYIAVSVDMLDTGIDVPEVVNLVFFKRVRSKAKFWQMIGRGTRLRKDLFGEDQHKTHFMIFDYLGNFEFFRQNKEGLQGAETLSLSELIFSKRVKLIQQLQHSSFIGEDYQAFRQLLIHEAWSQIKALNPELISVKMQLQFVEKFKPKEVFVSLSDSDVFELNTNLAPLVFMEDRDEYAKRFDNLMFGLMLGAIEENKQFKRNKKQLIDMGQALQTKATIPQVKAKITLIKAIDTEGFWSESGILDFEKVRVELRDLIKFIVDEGNSRIIYTNLQDEIVGERVGEALDAGYDFEDYRLKVNRYIENNKDHLAIHKLRNNLPLTANDYASLEHIFTGELGTTEDYEREFKDTPFGLLVRKIAKLEHEAAMQAFSTFINDQSLTQAQIVFVRKVIDYIAENGYIEATSVLMKPPFDRPQSFIKLFDGMKQKQLVELVNEVKENAVRVVG